MAEEPRGLVGRPLGLRVCTDARPAATRQAVPVRATCGSMWPRKVEVAVAVTAGAGTRTILFTDMVGSTALRSRLGDGPADEIRRAHDVLLAEVIGAHSGTVVKGTGDGVMAVFEGAADASACAVAMQQVIDRYRRRNGRYRSRSGSA